MAYFIYNQAANNQIYKIAENQSDLNNLNITQSDYKIIEDSQSNFDLVKFGNKYPIKYNNNTITYIDTTNSFKSKKELENCVNNVKTQIKQFTNNNPNHPLLSRWNDYYTQLNNLNLNSIEYPLNKSLEQYFKDQNQNSLNPLQTP